MCMSLPTTPVDEKLPKGPSFLPVVISFAVAIVLILAAAVFYMRGRAQKLVPMKTNTTPSQTLVRTTPTSVAA